MTNILFTHSYLYKLDTKQWKFKQPYPPLGTIYAAALCRAEGYNVSLFDTALESNTERLGEFVQKERPKYLVIYDDGFNYLTKMCLTVMREAAFDLAKRAKKFGCTVIICSSDAADHYEKYFPFGVDYVIRGEGEITLLQLLNALEKRVDPVTIEGIVFRKFGQTVVTSPRAVLRELDTLPLPAWDLVNMNAYRKIWKKHHGYFSINLATTRGCPFKCNWCAKPIYGNRYNSRSTENVLDEIELLIKNYKPDHFWFCDDIFGLKPGWVQQFRDEAKARNIAFKYKIQSRVDLLLQEDTVEALAESGAEIVWVGAESGSQKILDAMDKGTTVEQIYTASELLRNHGVKCGFFLQFGYPGETQQDVQQTIDMLLQIMPDEIGISISYPLPGTKFFETVRHQLGEKQNWSDSDDLDMMFQSTFNSPYYRQLHRYVHSEYRKHKGYSNLKKLFQEPLRLTLKDIRSGIATFYYLPKSYSQRMKLVKFATARVKEEF
jgi:anaerobic magnesium-protoporphyrin IX monomethyl ester cyclase